jgi:hypothetical protein
MMPQPRSTLKSTQNLCIFAFSSAHDPGSFLHDFRLIALTTDFIGLNQDIRAAPQMSISSALAPTWISDGAIQVS